MMSCAKLSRIGSGALTSMPPEVLNGVSSGDKRDRSS